MKYTKYFGEILAGEGEVGFSPSQKKRILNIIWLEGYMAGMARLRLFVSDPSIYSKIMFETSTKLRELTGGHPPELLIHHLKSESKHELGK